MINLLELYKNWDTRDFPYKDFILGFSFRCRPVVSYCKGKFQFLEFYFIYYE